MYSFFKFSTIECKKFFCGMLKIIEDTDLRVNLTLLHLPQITDYEILVYIGLKTT